MEHAIGTRITLEVAKREQRTPCKGCFFDYDHCCNAPSEGYPCDQDERTDHKNIIYKEIKEER